MLTQQDGYLEVRRSARKRLTGRHRSHVIEHVILARVGCATSEPRPGSLT